MHEQAVLGRAVAEPGERGRGVVDASTSPPNTSIALSDRAPTASAIRNSSRLVVREELLGVERGGNVHVGRARQPPPREVELGDREPVVGEQRADVGIVETVPPRAPVVTTPERDARRTRRATGRVDALAE